MLRITLAALAMLAASACSYGSAVDMAPMSARPSAAIFASGDYCEAKAEKVEGPFTIVSSQDCVQITWSKSTRTYTMTEKDAKDRKDDITAAVAPLGGDLFLAQIEAGDEDRDAPDKYQIQLLIARGNAFLVLPVLEDEPLAEIARKHPELTFGKKSSIARSPDGAPKDEDTRGRVYIAAGKPEDIKAFLQDVAREAVRTAKADEDKKDDISVGVRDSLGKRDHPASRTQAADIQAVLKSFDALAK